MASASFPSPALRPTLGERSRVRPIPPRIACLTILAPGPELWHHSRKRAATHLKKNDIPWRPVCASKSMSPPPEFPHQTPHSPLSEVIRDFYSAINDRDLSGLHSLISDDCIFEDLAYFSPLDRKRIQRFFKGLTQAMGKHTRFIIDRIHEGDGLTVAVMWHLEWNDKFIPFTKGCSFYRCSGDSERLLIKEARVFVESPLKPGDFAVNMLKTITSLFDRFPKLAERCLRKPGAIGHFIATICMRFIVPLILPFLVHYIATIYKMFVEHLILPFLDHVWRWMLQQIIKRFFS